MKNHVRKIISLSLLLIACIPVAFALFFLIRQETIQHKMMEKLERQSLHTITLAAGDVRWINKKEIWVNGKMFDVKSFSINGRQYEFMGLFDDEETDLAEQLKNKTKKDNEPGNSLLAGLFQWLHSLYPANSGEVSLAGSFSKLQYYFVRLNILSPFKAILTPPPQV